MFADWFMLQTGHRGAGLPHETLMDLMTKPAADGIGESFVTRLRRLYHLPVSDELSLIRELRHSGILDGSRRWRFVHDTFEEYFAASRLISLLANESPTLPLKAWQGADRQHDFLEVVEFLVEMADRSMLAQFQSSPLPASWRQVIQQKSRVQPDWTA